MILHVNNDSVKLKVSDPDSVKLNVSAPIIAETVPSYEGEYRVTPQTNAVILETFGKRMLHNVIVDPIPSNYGLVTWNGRTLTIS